MACCDEPIPAPGISLDLRSLPDDTFCCMGRMSYVVACAAMKVAAGKDFPTWDSFNELQKLELGATAKDIAVGDSDGNTELEKVMAAVLRAMTTAI